MTPLETDILDELRWYFEQARAHPAPSRCRDLDERFYRAVCGRRMVRPSLPPALATPLQSRANRPSAQQPTPIASPRIESRF
jgi:hypothetical protein